jgi:hypothetical protein
LTHDLNHLPERIVQRDPMPPVFAEKKREIASAPR